MSELGSAMSTALVLGLATLAFIVGLIVGELIGCWQREREAIQNGYGHDVEINGKREFRWKDKPEL